MTPALFVTVAAAGGLGAGLRYLVDLAAGRLVGDRLPWGVLAVNFSGALALGYVSGAFVADAVLWVIGVGFLGGYTTFSSVAVSTVLLAEEGRTRASIVYAVGSFAGSVVCATLGLAAALVVT